VETGSHGTAHTTIQSFQTTDFRGDSKEAVLAGIIAGSFLLFRLWGDEQFERAKRMFEVAAAKLAQSGGAVDGDMTLSLRQRLWRWTDRGHGYDIRVRKLGGGPVLWFVAPCSTSIPLTRRCISAPMERRRRRSR
jgi:hypothetical protein